MEDKKVNKSKTLVQNLILENRERLSISGVIDVNSFNDESIILETELGTLIVKGQDLHINKLNLDNAELVVEGDIESCTYSDKELKSKGFSLFSNLFK